MQELVDLLHASGCSLVLRSKGRVHTFRQRGVADLYRLLTVSPELLSGADVADKVVGKGAAVLMVLGGVKSVHADVVSVPASNLLREAGVALDYAEMVPAIRNRAGDGWCPVETVCCDCHTAEECLPRIRDFVERKAVAGCAIS